MIRFERNPGVVLLLLCSVLVVFAAGCGSQKITFVYPDESLDFSLRNLKMPAIYVEDINDLRPLAQRQGQGKFFKITYPKDEAWEAPATTIYADALAQDLDQTHLVEIVPLHAQADYILSLDLLSMGCRLERSPASFLVTGLIGAGLGMAIGGGGSDSADLAIGLAVVGMIAIPVPTQNRAETEVRMTLKDRQGNILWQESCLGEYEGKSYMSPTARKDQQLVDEYLTKAVKRANACLLGQMRQKLIELGTAD